MNQCPQCGWSLRLFNCGTVALGERCSNPKCAYEERPVSLAAENKRLRQAILDFLKWENEREHNEAEWLEATEKLATAAREGD